LRFLTVKTPNLLGRGDICLYLPRATEGLLDLPIYILLHGVYGSAWSWALQGGVHRSALHFMKEGEIKPAIIAMPSDGLWGDGTAYLPHHRRDFEQWIVKDVPQAIREVIPQAGEASPLFIGGLSMGGYGALMLGAKYPTLFQGISAHSAITRFEEMALFVEEPLSVYQKDQVPPDVIDLLRENRDQLPPLRFDCGRKDPLLTGNRLLREQMSQEQIPYHYEEFEGGHDWAYWQEQVKKTLLFFAKA